MKKESSSRRKKLPLLLGALLVISVAAYGTRAYFSDSATQQADIKLELGNLDINSVDSKWKYTPEHGIVNTALLAGKTEIKDGVEIDKTDAKNIKNVQPGDQFERTFIFTNVGNLAQNVTFKNTVTSDGIFNVDFEQVDDNGSALPEQNNSTEINSKKSVRYKMTISIDTDNSFDETYNNKNSKDISEDKLIFNALGDNAETVDIIENSVTVTAVQTNVSSN